MKIHQTNIKIPYNIVILILIYNHIGKSGNLLMKNNESVKKKVAILVTVLGALAFICSVLGKVKGTGGSYASILILIAAGIVWFTPLWKGIMEGRALQNAQAILEVHTYSKKMTFLKGFCYAAIAICIFVQAVLFKAVYNESHDVIITFCSTASYLAYLLLLIIWVMLIPFYYKGTVYDEGIMLLDGFIRWSEMTSYGYEKKGEGRFYIMEFRLQARTNISAVLPRIKRLYVTEAERNELMSILDNKKIKKINGI